MCYAVQHYERNHLVAWKISGRYLRLYINSYCWNVWQEDLSEIPYAKVRQFHVMFFIQALIFYLPSIVWSRAVRIETKSLIAIAGRPDVQALVRVF